MDAAPSPGFGLKDVKWSSVSIPLDLLVSTYRLPQVVKLDGGKSNRRGRRGQKQPGNAALARALAALGRKGARSRAGKTLSSSPPPQ